MGVDETPRASSYFLKVPLARLETSETKSDTAFLAVVALGPSSMSLTVREAILDTSDVKSLICSER